MLSMVGNDSFDVIAAQEPQEVTHDEICPVIGETAPVVLHMLVDCFGDGCREFIQLSINRTVIP